MTHTRQDIEAALDGHRLFVKMTRGRLWQARRNGATKLWKTKPDNFSIPFKYGLKECGRLTHDDLPNFDMYFEIAQ